MRTTAFKFLLSTLIACSGCASADLPQTTGESGSASHALVSQTSETRPLDVKRRLTSSVDERGEVLARGQQPDEQSSVSEDNSSRHSAKSTTVTARKFTSVDSVAVNREGNELIEVELDQLKQYLSRSLKEIERLPGYTATLEQQVQKDGIVRDSEVIDIKIRRAPFSAYLKWRSDGQEVLYVEGMHDNRLLARPTRGLAALRRIWRLHPKSPQAMKGTRYPLTEIGIEKLTLMALKFYEDGLNNYDQVKCTESGSRFGGKPSVTFHVTFPDQNVSPEYSSSHLSFDLESGLLCAVESYTWHPDGRPGLLLEKYSYHEVIPDHSLNDEDFSVANSNYHFNK